MTDKLCFILLPEDDEYVRQRTRDDAPWSHDEYSCPLAMAVERQLGGLYDDDFMISVSPRWVRNPNTNQYEEGFITVMTKGYVTLKRYRHNLSTALFVEYFDRSVMEDDDLIMRPGGGMVDPLDPIELTQPIAICLEEVPL